MAEMELMRNAQCNLSERTCQSTAVWTAMAGADLVRRVIQKEVLQRCVIPAKAGIQSPGTRGQVWMPAFAGMTLTLSE
jgi:hypothetical protein